MKVPRVGCNRPGRVQRCRDRRAGRISGRARSPDLHNLRSAARPFCRSGTHRGGVDVPTPGHEVAFRWSAGQVQCAASRFARWRTSTRRRPAQPGTEQRRTAVVDAVTMRPSVGRSGPTRCGRRPPRHRATPGRPWRRRRMAPGGGSGSTPRQQQHGPPGRPTSIRSDLGREVGAAQPPQPGPDGGPEPRGSCHERQAFGS